MRSLLFFIRIRCYVNPEIRRIGFTRAMGGGWLAVVGGGDYGGEW